MIEISNTLMDRALFDDDALIELSAAFRPARVERLDGKIVVSPGTGGETGRRNSRLTRLLDEYAETHGFVSFDSSTGFHMPDHDTPSADHALLRSERWALLSTEQKTKLPPVAPDVVIELCSENERGRASIVTKCQRWFDYGVGYVMLLDPFSQTVRAWGKPPDEFPDLSVIFGL